MSGLRLLATVYRKIEFVRLGRAVRLLKKFSLFCPGGPLPRPLYREVFLQIGAEANRSLGSRVRHLWPNQRFTTSNSHVFRKHAANRMLGERPMNTMVIRHLLQGTTSDLMTSAEAATYLCISNGTLRHWVSDRKIEFVKLGRAVRFRKAHLDRFISQKVQKKQSRG